MKRLMLAIFCVMSSLIGFAQNPDEPASRDDIILYLRTMRSHDMFQRTMEVQAENMRQLLRDTVQREKGEVPADFDTSFKTAMADLIKGMPSDQIVEAMIPAYQKHFTKGDIEAMNAFYSSPVGQKVLQELPAVMQEGSQAAMPIMSKYIADWMERIKEVFEKKKDAPGPKTAPTTVQPKDRSN
jgi:hypothetical protein